MSALGMIALGVFIGSIITIGIRQIKDWSDLGKLLTTIISAALAGAVFTFIEFMGGSKLGAALSLYPVGLVLGVIWANARAALENVQSQNGAARLLGWLHLVGLVIITSFVFAILLSSRFRSLLPPDLAQP